MSESKKLAAKKTTKTTKPVKKKAETPKVSPKIDFLSECTELLGLNPDTTPKEQIKKILISTNKALESKSIEDRARLILPILKEIYGK